MLENFKKLARKLPGGEKAVSTIEEYRRLRLLRSFKSKTDLFTHYYHNGTWGSAESPSGPGSTLAYTENIRREIPRLMESLGIKTLLDAPCGDFNWFRHVARGDGMTYIGGDIVPSLIARNNETFGNANTKFVVLDIIVDPLPEADLWLCRDCLFHLPSADVLRVLQRFKQSGIRYLLTSTYPEAETNSDIIMGDFRPLNLQLAPFNLCPPKLVIDDWMEGHHVRHLGLWERDMFA